MSKFAVALILPCLFATAALAQAVPDYRDDLPLDDYLAALGQLSPAAREGAEAFLQAHRARCGRALSTLELRRAVAEGSGDAVLMAMIRAAHERDAAATQRLAAAVVCRRS